ncbi:PHB depolymerase family esterase [Achromobacter marplatensis]|uniref:extracellular catalytic domain type 1 short-chain-length polyhydroxyalkanoate depolymerase n=1 Tax=Achromobacter marplatensis TaxID=470868 RepID=UPI0028EE9833|nr:PHB depolymerase family esterase [Achromobacter marplatensis]
MHPEFQQLMNQATRLTRSGDLAAATAAIQAALRGGATAAPAREDDSDVIDVEAWEVPEPAAPSARATATAAATAKAAVDGVAPPADKPATAGDTFTAGSFRNAGGHRSYKLYVPPNAGAEPRPLVVMLHGCTQDADDFAAGTAMNQAARAQGFYVLYPVQSRETNPQKCWNWFKHNHQQRGRGEPEILAGMTRAVIDSHAIDPQRVYVAGLSAGGAMAAILAGAYPDLFAAAGVHSGLAAGVAADLPSALSAMKGAGIHTAGQAASGVPTIVFHGDRDATVHPGNGQAVAAASAGAAAPVETCRVPGAGGKRHSTRYLYRNPKGDISAERWEIHGAGHAWAGGSASGSYTDQSGPDATAEMLRFFFERSLGHQR